MDFTVTFLKVFASLLYFMTPVLLFLLALIAAIGVIIGRREHWSIEDSLYYSFITATTVGYGDYHPRYRMTKFAAIVIALIGILLTGIIVAIGLKSLEVAFIYHYNIDQIAHKLGIDLEQQ